MRCSRLSLLFLLLGSLCLLLCLPAVCSDPISVRIPVILAASGVSLSADGTRAFIHTYGGRTSVYVLPLPFNTSNINPTPYWTSSTEALGIYFSAASLTTSPQVLYLMDEFNAQLLELPIVASPPTEPSVVIDLGRELRYLVGGMTRQRSSELLYLSLNEQIGGAVGDRVVFLDPTTPSPALHTLYTDSNNALLVGLVVSSTRLYFGTATLGTTRVAQIWSLPVNATNTTSPLLVYTTRNSNLRDLGVGDLVSPSGLALNDDESILYVCDVGNHNTQPSEAIQAIYALSPLQTARANLTVVFSIVRRLDDRLGQSFALAPDQSTLYFAVSSRARGGGYRTINANSSIPAQTSLSSSTGMSSSAAISTSSSISSSTSTALTSATSASSATSVPAATSVSAATSISSATSAPAGTSTSTSISSVSAGAVTSVTELSSSSSVTGQSSSSSAPPVDPSSSEGKSTGWMGPVIGGVVGIVVIVLVGVAVYYAVRRYMSRAPVARGELQQSLMSEPSSSAG